jgi:hypothetical protein
MGVGCCTSGRSSPGLMLRAPFDDCVFASLWNWIHGQIFGLKSYYEKYILITINGSVWRNEPKLNQHVSWAEAMSI